MESFGNDNKQEIDYSSVKKILNKRRKESLEFLDASLSKVQSSNNN